MAAGGPAPTDANALELRGVMSTSDGDKYNIYDPAKKTSVWVGLNEAGNGFLIKSANLNGTPATITVAVNGQQMVLALKESKVQTAAAFGLPQGGAVLRPTPADEQARLQAVADEVRRRRLLRQQAEQQQLGHPGAGALPPSWQRNVPRAGPQQ